MEYIKINQLTQHSKNNYFFDDITGDNWEEFKKSIKTSGVIEPIVITQDNVIVSGHQRVKACIELGIEEVPYERRIYEDDGRWTKDDKIIKDLLETNLPQRGIGNTNALKMARCIQELERIYGIKQGNNQHSLLNNSTSSQAQLAEELGIDRTQLINYKKLLTLIPELQDLIENGTLSPTVGYKVLSKLNKQEQEKLIAEFGKDYISKLTQKKAEELIKNIKPKVIDNTDYDTIDKLKKELAKKEKDMEFLRREKDILERKVKLNEEDAKKYNDLKKQIDELTHTREDIKRQIDAATSISGLVVEIDNLLKTKLAPIRYSKAILEMSNDKIVVQNLTAIIEAIESWCREMRNYLPNNNIIEVEVR